MTRELLTLDMKTCADWRRWLTKHHSSSPGVWLLRHKSHTGVESMAYEDLVREALCFGWIDSLIKRLDDDCYAIKVTPRQPTSKWSDLNRKRWKQLVRSLEVLSDAFGAESMRLRRLDSYRQAARDPREADSRVDCASRGWKKARPEIDAQDPLAEPRLRAHVGEGMPWSLNPV